MRLFQSFIIVAPVAASWFGSDAPQYNTWSTSELQKWLADHNIPVPSSSSHESLQSQVEKHWNTVTTWTQDQYSNAQETFDSIRDDTFDTWDESQLRSWLLEQGVVAPKDNKEELVVRAKQQYKAYLEAASQWSNWASDTASAASASMTSYAASATNEAAQMLDDTKDYVYSTWEDNRLRTYLEDNGVIKTKQEKKREELLKMMRQYYPNVPVYDAWSTSYIHSWLVNHNLISPTPTPAEKARQSLVDKMNQYYYTVNSFVWDSWSDSELRSWLVDNGIAKEKDVKGMSKDKMVKMVSDSYANTISTITNTWSDSQIREWLVKNKVLSGTETEQLKRDGLIKHLKEKFPSHQSKDIMAYTPQPFVTWPDSRLRAFLVETGVKERDLPSTRAQLLTRVSNVWNKTVKQDPEALYTKIQKIVDGGVGKAEEKLTQVWEVLKGYYAGGVEKADAEEKEAKQWAKQKKGKLQNEL